MLRTFEYLKGTMSLGILVQAHESDIPLVIVDLSADADFANSVTDVKSTSGYDTAIAGPRTWIPYEWAAKTQGNTARSTAESELVSLDLATFRSGIPAVIVLERILERPVRLVA